jgi:putative two-component system hydrogenase maturation factor HypX/HoxX
MRVLLLVTAFNSLTQAVFSRLRERGDTVAVAYAIGEGQMLSEIEAFAPEMILSPYLKRYLPPSIYEAYPTYVFHPGPRGDRGALSLEYALLTPDQPWGVVILRANAQYDGGDIYAQAPVAVGERTKASLYRQAITRAALEALESFLSPHPPAPLPQQMHPLHAPLSTQWKRIDWAHDTTRTILRKIRLHDSQPGIADTILGVECRLFGAHEEARFEAFESMHDSRDLPPKTLLAKRDGAICLRTIDGAIWVSHLMEPDQFKLPATYVLKRRLQGVKEERLPLIFDRSYATFHEVWATHQDGVAYLHFEFHNGAMSAAQCVRLKYAVEYLRGECDVLVLMGGEDFFSNGIHLNLLEDSQKQGEDGWENINAMNDLIRAVLTAEEVTTIAAFGRNAGAGGVFLGLACDHVVAREGVVLNPHYRTLGLSGSEYHTWSLPRRVGKTRATQILEACLPLSAAEAESIGLIDAVLPDADYDAALHVFAVAHNDEDTRWDKAERIEQEFDAMEACREQELAIMHPEFWDAQSPFHPLRQAFVYKACPIQTPGRLRVENG